MYTTVRVNIISSEFDKLKRRVVKFWRFGKDDVNTAIETSPFGIDSSPIKGMAGLYAETAKIGESVLIGYINQDQLAAIGETRIFSKDAAGAVKAFIWAKNDGILLLNGDTNFAVKFNELKEAFDELQDDVNTLKQNFTSWTPVANDGGAALKAATAAWFAATLVKNIDDAKNTSIKTS